ncbi:MAG: SpoIIE family protein phosphatase [Candidatus Methylacidiphilales bacterium]|nr:SpoIIE family protein phosphatase [Candidatus Methylacidiphilales bacterium]
MNAFSSRRIQVAEWSECRLPPSFEAVTEAMVHVEEYCRARGLRKSLWPNILLATTETLNNAVEHGCKYWTPPIAHSGDTSDSESTPIQLKWSWAGSILAIEITDPGTFMPGPDHGKLPDDPMSEGGRGAYLISQLCKSVRHCLNNEGDTKRHCVRLEFEVGETTWTPGQAAELEQTIDSMAEDLSTSYENISALFRFAEELATSDTFASFAEKALRRLLAIVNGTLAYIRLHRSGEPAELQLTSSLSTLPAEAQPALAPVISADSEWAEATACKSRRELTLEDCAALDVKDPMAHIPGSAVVSPVFFRESIVGCLVVTRPLEAEYFSAGETALVRVVADFLGVVYTTHVLQEQRQAQLQLRRELQIASDIQQSLLPRHFPTTGEYRVYGVCHSATHVGGDYFDVIHFPEKRGMLLVMADVMGKGVPASLLASNMRAALRARPSLACSPGQLLTELNRQLVPDLERLEMFITAQIAWLSEERNELLMANAGHCPLLVQDDPEEPARLVGLRSFPIGITPTAEFTDVTIPLPPGCRIVMHTDGLYEVENEEGEMLGQRGLAERMPDLWRGAGPEELCTRLLQFLRTYTSDAKPSDDRTMLAVQHIVNQ